MTNTGATAAQTDAITTLVGNLLDGIEAMLVRGVSPEAIMAHLQGSDA